MKELFRAVNNAWYEQMDVVNPNIVDFCFDSGFWSWKDTRVQRAGGDYLTAEIDIAKNAGNE